MRIAEECEEDNRMRCLQHPLVYNTEIEVEHAKVGWSYHIHENSDMMCRRPVLLLLSYVRASNLNAFT